MQESKRRNNVNSLSIMVDNDVFVLFEDIKTALKIIDGKLEKLDRRHFREHQQGPFPSAGVPVGDALEQKYERNRQLMQKFAGMDVGELKKIGEELHKIAAELDSRSGQMAPCPDYEGEDAGRHAEPAAADTRLDKARFAEIIDTLRQSGIIAADEAAERHPDNSPDASFTVYIGEQIARLKRLGKVRTSETYTSAFKSFSGFVKYRDVLFRELDANMIAEYEVYLKERGNSPNTVSFYMRILKAVYNRAVENGLTEQHYPFKSVFTGVEKTLKRAISINDIRQIKSMDLSMRPNLDFARDVFLFCFYTRGMSFVDMAYLRKKDIANGILTYRRKKTGQQLFVRWERCMQEILDKYPANATEFLLPIITEPDEDYRRQYTNGLHRVNCLLKTIGRKLDLPIPLTMYVARHSWASIAKNRNIPISVISECMGHDSESTTQIYLASLDATIVDRVNSEILDLL